MKNFNIFWVHWKTWFLGGLTKKQYRWGNCLKSGAWTVCKFKEGGLSKNKGVVFLRGFDTLMHTMRLTTDFCYLEWLPSIELWKKKNKFMFWLASYFEKTQPNTKYHTSAPFCPHCFEYFPYFA